MGSVDLDDLALIGEVIVTKTKNVKMRLVTFPSK